MDAPVKPSCLTRGPLKDRKSNISIAKKGECREARRKGSHIKKGAAAQKRIKRSIPEKVLEQGRGRRVALSKRERIDGRGGSRQVLQRTDARSKKRQEPDPKRKRRKVRP